MDDPRDFARRRQVDESADRTILRKEFLDVRFFF
jgi:hypothetical protein